MKLTQITVFVFLAIMAPSYSVHGAVLDIAGEFLRPGDSYYVLPVFRGSGGGLTLGASRDNTTLCPLDVVQEGFELDNGTPVKFYPKNSKVGFVPESTDLNVEFDVGATICIQSTVWKLDAFDEERKRWFVTTSGTKGSPGKDTISNWFKIVEYESDYKFVYCPTVCDLCRPVCGDIGLYFDKDDVRRLALSSQPFQVKFKKADDADAGQTGSS